MSYRMRAKLCSDQIDDAFPVGAGLGMKPEREKRIGRRATIPENSRALLAADSHGLMPLNGTEIIWNRRGHLGELRKKTFFEERFPRLDRSNGGRHTERLDITTRDLVT
jgi:hypothetical protein